MGGSKPKIWEVKTVYSSLSDVPDNGLTQNKGIYLVKLNSSLNDKIVAGNYICFNGDGDLEVIVKPKEKPYGKIKFNCTNEYGTTHELFKEGNFCIEPSQMTNNGDGRQYVSYTASTCNISATCEYTNYQTINITSASDIKDVRLTITGHKRDMEWKLASRHPVDIDSTKIHEHPVCKPIEYDGTTCYMAGKSGIYKSENLGTTWTYVDYGFWNDYPKLCYGAGLCFWINNEGYMHVFDPELPVFDVDRTVFGHLGNCGASDQFWGGITYANGSFLTMTTYGEIYKSENGFVWTYVGQEGSLVNSSISYTRNFGFDTGVVFIDGIWYAVTDQTSNALPIICSSDGTKWSTAVVASTSVAPGLYAVKDGTHFIYIAYGSNRYMVASFSGRIITSNGLTANSSYFCHKNIKDDTGLTGIWGISCANGRFLAKLYGGYVAYTTYHDGVIWINNQQKISQEKAMNVSMECANNNGQNTQIKTTNFVVTDISATYLKIADPIDYTIEFTKPRLPKMSRTVDFSQNVNGKPAEVSEQNTSLIAWETTYANYCDYLYDNTLGYWRSAYLKGLNMYGYPFAGYNHTYWAEFKGDYYCFLEDIGIAPPLLSSRRMDDGTNDTSSALGRQKYRPGLVGEFIDSSGLAGSMQAFDIYNVEKGASYKYIMTGVTLPINAALWAGASGNTLHNYQWQSDTSGNWNGDGATTAVKRVTQSACAKLKEKYGDNLRIYLIKYRKQTQYKHPVTQTATKFDYSYLNNCASGTSAPYMYDITTEAQLKSALDAIYTDIEKWAGKTEARNVN